LKEEYRCHRKQLQRFFGLDKALAPDAGESRELGIIVESLEFI